MKSALLFVFTIMLLGCNSNTLFNGSQKINNGMWSKSVPVNFNFEIEDNSANYNLYLDILHNTTYPYENIYLRIQTGFPNATSVQDTLSIEMTNDMGYWVGKCSGDDCKLRVFLQEKIKFSDIGKYNLSFEQFTRDEDLAGIEQLDFTIELVQ